VNQIVEINKYFCKHHADGSLLDKKQGSVKPQLTLTLTGIASWTASKRT